MSKQTAWLENFTGLPLDPSGGQSPERLKEIESQHQALLNQAEKYQMRREKQAELLAFVRGKLAQIKYDVQDALSTKIEQGPLKGRFLDIEGNQRTELDIDDVPDDGTASEIPKSIREALVRAEQKINNLGGELSSAQIEIGGKKEPLFTDAEVQEEFWTPLKLERIFPEGFIPAKFSETQQMLDATNELYLQMVEEKRLAGQLTPPRDFVGDLMDSGADLLSLATKGLGGFSGDEVKLATEILTTGSEVLRSTKELYSQFKDSDYGAAASGALDLAGKLTGVVLGALKVPSDVIGTATGAISAGSQAALMGKSLMKFRNGEASLSEALALMGGVIAQALSTASAARDVPPEAAKGLALAAKGAPAAFKSAGLASSLPGMVRAGDFKGIVDSVAGITQDVLAILPGLDKVGVDLKKVVDLSAAGVNLTIQMAVNLKKGEYLQAFNGVIDGIGQNLGSLLGQAGVDPGVAAQVVGIYKASASASNALQCMASNPPNVVSAIGALTGGLKDALDGSGDKTLGEVGSSLEVALQNLVKVEEIQTLYDKVKDDAANGDKALSLLKQQLSVDLSSLVTLPESVKGGARADPEKLKNAVAGLEKKNKAERDKADAEEAKLTLDELELNSKSLSEAEQLGAEASNIEGLIADLLRDRMLLKLATQIAEGGAGFLAKFVPALGAVGAAVKLAASLAAAGQRARQLDQWIASQGDLDAAQSSLSSAAANFVKNQGKQLAHYSAQALLAAVQLAGEIAATTGLDAGIGKAISGLASAGASGEEIMMNMSNKSEVEAAWKVTVKSLRNPGNRKLGLQARELNPSLAKFSIAWGAVVLKDPLARNAMTACGLNEASLKEADKDVKKVVKYLETFYEDDPTLYREDTGDAPDWMPAELELTLLSWSNLRRLADTPGGIVIGAAETLEGWLGQFITIEEGIAATSAELDTQQSAFAIARKSFIALGDGKDGGDKPVLPASTPLETAIRNHAAKLEERKNALQEIERALKRCAPALKAPTGNDKDGPGLMSVVKALTRLSSQASRSAKATETEAEGLKLAQLQLKNEVASLQRGALKPQAKTEETASN